MMYLSKGILLWKPSEAGLSVSHCGALYKLAEPQSTLWLAGQLQPGLAVNIEHSTALKQLAGMGIVEYSDETDSTALFRLLINCAICPVRVKAGFTLLSRQERYLWRWIRYAGLRLTIAELTLLAEHGIKPVPSLLGKENRQALTEAIYTTENIAYGILEASMEKSPARDATTLAILGLLRKRKIFLM